MQKHNVKCPICEQIFDLNTVQGVKYRGRRYAHQTCYPEGEIVPLPTPSKKIEYTVKKPKVEEIKKPEVEAVKTPPPPPKSERLQFTDYVQNLFGKDNCNWGLISKQMKQYMEEYHYSYSGMKKTLQWYYEITKHPKANKNGGIGIIPYNYKQAYDYFYKIYQAELLNKNVIIDKDEIKKNVEVNIAKPKRGNRAKLKLMECSICLEGKDEE